ncbi:DinB family protein [bacterium]|nr:DinB family protein [bacterium]
MISEIKELFEYDAWANTRIFDAVSKLTPDEFTSDLKSSFPSVRDTLLHLISAEWVWLTRWKGSSPSGAPKEWDTSSCTALRAIWSGVDKDVRTMVNALDEAELRRVLTYKNTAGKEFSNPIEQMLRHMINHSTYHRGQVTTMLRQLGKDTVGTDLILFYREKRM